MVSSSKLGAMVFAGSIVSVAVVVSLVLVLSPTPVPGTAVAAKACALRQAEEDSFVCVCNSTYCDTVPPVPKLSSALVVRYTSSKDGLRFNVTTAQFAPISSSTASGNITIATKTRYQEIKGFGAAFTDAAGINVASLDSDTQDNLLRSYFSPDGIEYNMGRIPMASCDFSTRGYTYDDYPNDFTMANFSLQDEDHKYKIPLIHRAMDMNSRKMSFYGSPWTAPAWMKTNNDLIGKGSLKGNPGEKYYHAWALYFARFIGEYAKNNITLWGVTAQNEPSDGNIENFPFQCMGFSPEMQRDFVKLDLGPVLKSQGHGDVKIMIMDDQRLLLPEWPMTVLNDSAADEYVDGIAVHWYVDFLVPANVLSKTHDLFPSKFLLATEACAGAIPYIDKAVILGSWRRGEQYSNDIIDDLSNWVTGWVDWNLALDMDGGPNWKNNFVDSPIIVNADADEFYKQPMFYHMGHFSKFIPEGSLRVDSVSRGLPSNLKQVAFFNPATNTVTLVVLNKSDDAIQLDISDVTLGSFHTEVPARSINTYLWAQ